MSSGLSEFSTNSFAKQNEHWKLKTHFKSHTYNIWEDIFIYFFCCYTWGLYFYVFYAIDKIFNLRMAFRSVYLCKNETIEICCMATRQGRLDIRSIWTHKDRKENIVAEYFCFVLQCSMLRRSLVHDIKVNIESKVRTVFMYNEINTEKSCTRFSFSRLRNWENLKKKLKHNFSLLLRFVAWRYVRACIWCLFFVSLGEHEDCSTPNGFHC